MVNTLLLALKMFDYRCIVHTCSHTQLQSIVVTPLHYKRLNVMLGYPAGNLLVIEYGVLDCIWMKLTFPKHALERCSESSEPVAQELFVLEIW